MQILLQIGQNWPLLPNISTTTEPVFTNVSAFVDVCTVSQKNDNDVAHYNFNAH